MIATNNLSIQFGAKPLFDKVSIKFRDGNRYGLIGANGCGKSTFLKILGGELEATQGNITIDEGQRLGKLRQDQFGFEEYTVMETVLMGDAALWEIMKERERIYALPEMSEEDGVLVAELEMKFAEMDGYTAESRAGELLLGVGIEEDLHFGSMTAVAPGWKLRVLLAQALFANPEILLLDEPTNNLDINTIRWLEGVLNERQSTMIIISHDRHFLNSVCTHMADVDYGTIQIYPGNYDDFMTAKTQARERLVADNARKKEKIAELQGFVSRFSANASKSRQATSRAKQIDKIELAEIKPSSRVYPFIRFEQDKKLYRNIIEVEGLTQGYGDDPDLFSGLNLMIESGEKIAIIGPNGIGKTTLLKTLVGELAQRSGKLKWSENAQLGYFAQDHADDFEEDKDLMNWMWQWGQPGDDEQAMRAVLGKMLFSRDEITKSVKVISGGEQGRMLFGKLMLQKPNVMLLDEPTNHLDMESIEALNTAIEGYEGTVIFVSHDREFVSSVATRILEMTPTGIVEYMGNYEEYLKSQGIEG